MKNGQHDILIVGAGISGSTLARCLAEAGWHVIVIDKRNHIAGNAYDFLNNFNIRMHKYGPHIFHTSNEIIINWVKKFSDWIDYKHKVKALLSDGTYVSFPANRITRKIVGDEKILDVFYRPYTKKMWGMDLEEIDPQILSRVPMKDDDNELYFPKDTFQALPKSGYTEFVKNILDHPFITVQLNTDFKSIKNQKFFHVFNSMAIDEFFNFEFGALPYRSIKFHHFHIPIPQILPCATVNFTHDERYTRVTEWKQFPNSGQNVSHTSLTIEEPCCYKENNFERFYPVRDVNGKNANIYKQYKNASPDDMTFIGRCGLYTYLDMHQAINSSFAIFREFQNSKTATI